VGIVPGGIETDLHHATGLFDAQLKDGPVAQKFVVPILANPARGIGRLRCESESRNEKDCCCEAVREADRPVHQKNIVPIQYVRHQFGFVGLSHGGMVRARPWFPRNQM
jgi:hypothetical protein